jgi:hypothetical protein
MLFLIIVSAILAAFCLIKIRWLIAVGVLIFMAVGPGHAVAEPLTATQEKFIGILATAYEAKDICGFSWNHLAVREAIESEGLSIDDAMSALDAELPRKQAELATIMAGTDKETYCAMEQLAFGDTDLATTHRNWLVQ